MAGRGVPIFAICVVKIALCLILLHFDKGLSS